MARIQTEANRRELIKYIETGQPHLLRESLAQVHPADQSEIAATLDKHSLTVLLGIMEDEQIRGMFRFLRGAPESRRSIIETLPSPRRTSVLSPMSDEGIAEVLRGIETAFASNVLAAMPAPRPEDIRKLLDEPRRGVEKLMTLDFLTVSEDDIVRDVLDTLRGMKHTEGRPAEIYVTDSRGCLRGAVELHLLMLTGNNNAAISSVMKDTPLRIFNTSDAVDAARKMLRYGLGSGPVVNRANELLGVVTADAAFRFLDERHEASLDCVGAVGRIAHRAGGEASSASLRSSLSLAPVIAMAAIASIALQLIFQRLFPNKPELLLFAWAPLCSALSRLFYWHVSLLLQKLDPAETAGFPLRHPRVRAGLIVGAVMSPVIAAAAGISASAASLGYAVGVTSLWTMFAGSMLGWLIFRSTSRSRPTRSLYLTPAILSAGDFIALAGMSAIFFLLKG